MGTFWEPGCVYSEPRRYVTEYILHHYVCHHFPCWLLDRLSVNPSLILQTTRNARSGRMVLLDPLHSWYQRSLHQQCVWNQFLFWLSKCRELVPESAPAPNQCRNQLDGNGLRDINGSWSIHSSFTSRECLTGPGSGGFCGVPGYSILLRLKLVW